MEFERITLQPMSWLVLKCIGEHDSNKSEELANQLGLSTRQVDAVITRSLVPRGFCYREAKLTRLMRKEYNLIRITEKGKRYVSWRVEKEEMEIRRKAELKE